MARGLFCLIPNEIVSDMPGADNSTYFSFIWPHKKGGGSFQAIVEHVYLPNIFLVHTNKVRRI